MSDPEPIYYDLALNGRWKYGSPYWTPDLEKIISEARSVSEKTPASGVQVVRFEQITTISGPPGYSETGIEAEYRAGIRQVRCCRNVEIKNDQCQNCRHRTT